jgi:beta-phosphoglucomutase-like phosphatase (HAD superfamily)
VGDDRIELPADVADILNRQSGVIPDSVDAYPDTTRPVSAGFTMVPGNNGHGLMERLTDDEAGKERARQMQAKSRGPYREARALKSAEARESAAEILEEIQSSMQIAKARRPNASIPKMADDIVRQSAAAILRGGPIFAPVNGKEATEMAKTWSAIASQYRLGRAAQLIDATATPDSTATAIQGVKELLEQARRRQNSPGRPVIPGQVVQIGDEPDEDPEEDD